MKKETKIKILKGIHFFIEYRFPFFDVVEHCMYVYYKRKQNLKSR